MAYAINLKTATYDPAGIVSATWDLLKLDGNVGFSVRIDWMNGFNAFLVRDAAAVSVSLPMQFDTAYTYSLTLYGLKDDDDENDDVYSAQLQIPDWPPSRQTARS
ncbi:hypothetical protein [Bordetella flabilis]|uniref:Uncharacterized protein n=1 Tax=Bordetella flabilis TaxID=463014 RepID=A0A193GIQ8_9BORD|nr:hypothetical protein [Bordetella flabilis]ANN79306.1 hypothetical protein BAU07_21215 [Bordetella flabilis]